MSPKNKLTFFLNQFYQNIELRTPSLFLGPSDAKMVSLNVCYDPSCGDKYPALRFRINGPALYLCTRTLGM